MLKRLYKYQDAENKLRVFQVAEQIKTILLTCFEVRSIIMNPKNLPCTTIVASYAGRGR